MKKICFLFIMLASGITVLSQVDTTAPYYKAGVLPDFSLLTIDSVEFNQTVLDKSKATIIVLFNPECDHCQHQLETLLSIPELLKDAQIILSSIEIQEKKSFSLFLQISVE